LYLEVLINSIFKPGLCVKENDLKKEEKKIRNEIFMRYEKRYRRFWKRIS